MKYYGVDTVNPGDFATLASYHINTAFVFLTVGSSESTWQAYFTAAEAHDMMIMVWPGGGSNVCGFPYKGDGSDISEAHRLLDFLGRQEKFVAILNSHEPFWKCLKSENDIVGFMANSKTAIKDYIWQNYNRQVEVYNYVDNVVAEIPSQYHNHDDIGRIMDIAGTYQHCFNGTSSCQVALDRINEDRALINSVGLDGEVDLAFAFQTFGGYGGGYRMPSAEEMRVFGCEVLRTNALDGFFWYPWRNPGSYSQYLVKDRYDDSGEDRWEAMRYVWENCVNAVD